MEHGDYPISQLRIVTVFMRDPKTGGSASPPHFPRFMHESEVNKFVEATIDLHFRKKRNPYNDKEVAELYRIDVAKLSLGTKSYWWCGGAELNGDYEVECRFIHPSVLRSQADAIEANAKREADALRQDADMQGKS